MTAEEAVAARLLDITDVTSLVSERVYMQKFPQRGTYPAIRVQLVHEPTDYHLRGGHRDRARVQVDAVVHETPGVDAYAEVTGLADAIHGDDAGSGLSAWQGSLGSPTFTVTGILRIERAAPENDPDELQLLRQRQDYWIFFQT